MATIQTQKKYLSAGDMIEGLDLKSFATICSVKALRGAPKLLPKVAVGGVSLLLLTYLWSLYLAGTSFSPNYFEVQKWRPEEAPEVDGRVGGGVRIVVFGGGDVATPNKPSRQLGEKDSTWTDIMCQELGCDSHISMVPSMDNSGGAVVSNSLFKAAHDRISETSPDNNLSAGLDYSWIEEHYPAPTHQDLASQINTFLAIPRPQNPPQETLWVFNFGFWDIWNLAAMPRKLATDVIDTQAQHLFSYIEYLYNEAQKSESVAFSDYHHASAGSSTIDPSSLTPRAPFRILIPKLFDISLTPGFESARPEPPHPHTRAEHIRNAAFLTGYWDALMQELTSQWLDLPDPETWSVEDAVDIDIIEAVVGKRSEKGDKDEAEKAGRAAAKPPASIPRREAAAYDMSRYLRELITERQFRGANIADHNGVGSLPAEYGFEEVREPCVTSHSAPGSKGHEDEKVQGEAGYEMRSAGAGPCDSPREHLFWTEFAVHQRAVVEIGRRAAAQLARDAGMGVGWRKKAQLSIPPVGGGRGEHRTSGA